MPGVAVNFRGGPGTGAGNFARDLLELGFPNVRIS